MPPTNGATSTAASVPVDPDIVISLRLSVGQVNQVLEIIGTQPLGNVLGLYTSIRTQGDMALAAARSQQADPPPVPPKEPPPDPPPPESKPNRAARRSIK